MNEHTEKKEQKHYKHYKNAKKLFFINCLEKIKFIPVCIMLTLIGSVRKLNQRQNEFRSIIRTYHNH